MENCVIIIVLVVVIQLNQFELGDTRRKGNKMFTLDFSSRKPIYEQLYNNVVKLVSLGVLKPDDKLPPVRTLATELSVNPNTVSKAYKLLENDGYICSAVGKGSFISSDISAHSAEKKVAVDKLEIQLKSAIDLGLTRDELDAMADRHFSEK